MKFRWVVLCDIPQSRETVVPRGKLVRSYGYGVMGTELSDLELSCSKSNVVDLIYIAHKWSKDS